MKNEEPQPRLCSRDYNRVLIMNNEELKNEPA